MNIYYLEYNGEILLTNITTVILTDTIDVEQEYDKEESQ